MLETESSYQTEDIIFKSDDYALKGTLHLPKEVDPSVVIGVHGLFSDRNSPKQIALAEKFNKDGMAFFRFDHRGCGESEGVFADVTTFDGRCKDLIHAVKAIQSHEGIGRLIGFFGSSFGGAVCIAVAASLSVPSLVTYAAPIESNSILHPLDKTDALNPHEFSFDRKKLAFDIRSVLPDMHDILIFHGDSDNVVPPSHARNIYNQASNPKRLIMQRGGDHRMSDPENQDRFVRETVLWFKQVISDKPSTVI